MSNAEVLPANVELETAISCSDVSETSPRRQSFLLRGIQAASDFLTPIHEKIRSLPVRTRVGVAIGAIGVTAFQPQETPNISPLSPSDAGAIISGDVSYRQNGVASPPLPGKTTLHFRDIKSALEISSKYRNYYLFHCTYSMSQNELNNSIKRLATKRNDNAALLTVTTNPRSNYFAKNSIAKDVGDFDISAPRCTTPEWEARTRYTIEDSDDLERNVDKIRKNTGCTRVAMNYWRDQVYAINPEIHSDDSPNIFDPGWIGIDGMVRFQICFKLNRANLSGAPRPKNGPVIIDDPFRPEDLYAHYGLIDENPRP